MQIPQKKNVKFQVRRCGGRGETNFCIDLDNKQTKLKEIIEVAEETMNNGYKKGFGPVIAELARVEYDPAQYGSPIKVKNCRPTLLKQLSSIKDNAVFVESVKNISQAMYDMIVSPKMKDEHCGLQFVLKDNPKYDDDDPQFDDD